MTEIRRGVFNPHGKSLTLGDLRTLVSQANKLRYPDACLIELTTPISGNRRAVTIAVVETDSSAKPGEGTEIAAEAAPPQRNTAHG